MTENPDFDRSRLSTSELTEFASSNSPGTVNVIIEAAATPPAFQWSEPEDESTRPRPQAVLPADEDADRQAMDRLQRHLQELDVRRLVRLDAALAFAAEVTAQQLQRVSRLSSVSRVQLNRAHSNRPAT